MTEKRFTTVELPKPNKWGIWYDGAYLSTYQVCILLNEYIDVKKENEQLKADNNRLVNETARIVAEHQKKVFDLIDEKIKELSTTIEYGDIQIFAQYVLYDLKRELEE